MTETMQSKNSSPGKSSQASPTKVSFIQQRNSAQYSDASSAAKLSFKK